MTVYPTEHRLAVSPFSHCCDFAFCSALNGIPSGDTGPFAPIDFVKDSCEVTALSKDGEMLCDCEAPVSVCPTFPSLCDAPGVESFVAPPSLGLALSFALLPTFARN